MWQSPNILADARLISLHVGHELLSRLLAGSMGLKSGNGDSRTEARRVSIRHLRPVDHA